MIIDINKCFGILVEFFLMVVDEDEKEQKNDGIINVDGNGVLIISSMR